MLIGILAIIGLAFIVKTAVDAIYKKGYNDGAGKTMEHTWFNRKKKNE